MSPLATAAALPQDLNSPNKFQSGACGENFYFREMASRTKKDESSLTVIFPRSFWQEDEEAEEDAQLI